MPGVVQYRIGMPDSAICAALHAACFPPQQVWDAAFFTRLLQLSSTRGAEAVVNNTVVGFILWQQDALNAEIYTLAVLPDFRRQNIGQQLLQRAQHELERAGAAAIVLDVAVDNSAAAALYQQAGFHEIAVRKGYYQRTGGAVDARVLQKVLR